jgi:hypothetical protein
MTTDGTEAVLLETHNWGNAAKCLQAPGERASDAATHHG